MASAHAPAKSARKFESLEIFLYRSWIRQEMALLQIESSSRRSYVYEDDLNTISMEEIIQLSDCYYCQEHTWRASWFDLDWILVSIVVVRLNVDWYHLRRCLELSPAVSNYCSQTSKPTAREWSCRGKEIRGWWWRRRRDETDANGDTAADATIM